MTLDNEAQESFNEHYRIGRTPWDSGISPPELLEAVTGQDALPPGHMLDLGCGTGINCIALARLGWLALGVDFATLAIEKARTRAREAAEEIASAGGRADFLHADITQLTAPETTRTFSLLLDIGCLNSVVATRRIDYARVAAAQALPDALFLLYAHLPDPMKPRPRGCTPEEIDSLFAGTFRLEKRVMSHAPQGGQSMWNWLRRL